MARRAPRDDAIEESFVPARSDAVVHDKVDEDVVEDDPAQIEILRVQNEIAPELGRPASREVVAYLEALGGKPAETVREHDGRHVNEDGGHVGQRVQNQGLAERKHTPPDATVRQDVPHVKQRFILRKEEAVDENQPVDAIAEIEQKIVLLLLLERPPAMKNVGGALGRMPEIKILRCRAGDESGEHEIDGRDGVRDLVNCFDVFEGILCGVRRCCC